MDEKSVLDFIFELGQLKRVKHAGWQLIKVDSPESVADHGLRAAQIGFILARLEKYDKPLEVCGILLFHDIIECRIGDIHKIANRYVTADKEQVLKDQLGKLGSIGEEILQLLKQMKAKDTKAGIIAKDADYLEQAFTAKEYIEKGYAFAQNWIDNVEKALKTESAKKLLNALKKANSNDWWQGLKKI